MKQLAFSLAILGACIISGCNRLKPRQIVGTWKDTSENSYESEMTFNENGSFSADVQLKEVSAPDHVMMIGTWKVADGKLTYTVDHSTYDNEKFAGTTDVDTVTSINDQAFEVVDGKGKKRTFTRVKQ